MEKERMSFNSQEKFYDIRHLNYKISKIRKVNRFDNIKIKKFLYYKNDYIVRKK